MSMGIFQVLVLLGIGWLGWIGANAVHLLGEILIEIRGFRGSPNAKKGA